MHVSFSLSSKLNQISLEDKIKNAYIYIYIYILSSEIVEIRDITED